MLFLFGLVRHGRSLSQSLSLSLGLLLLILVQSTKVEGTDHDLICLLLSLLLRRQLGLFCVHGLLIGRLSRLRDVSVVHHVEVDYMGKEGLVSEGENEVFAFLASSHCLKLSQGLYYN